MDELDFARFEFKMSFGRISYIAQSPWSPLVYIMNFRLLSARPWDESEENLTIFYVKNGKSTATMLR